MFHQAEKTICSHVNKYNLFIQMNKYIFFYENVLFLCPIITLCDKFCSYVCIYFLLYIKTNKK